MATQVRNISLADFHQQLDLCFSEAVAGCIVRITSAEHDALLIGEGQWQFIIESLLHLETLLYK